MSSWSPSTGSSWGAYIPSVQTVSSAVCGAGAVASEVIGAVSSSVPRESALSQWMPPSMQAYLPGRDSSKNADDRDQVVSVTFDQDVGSPAQPQLLCMCFRNGFQVWEVQDQAEGNTQATRETQPLREVLSVRQGYTRLAKVLPSTAVPEGAPLHGRQPALAVVSGEEVGDANVLRIFSLRDHGFIHQMRFHGDVYGVVCNKRWLVVVLKNQLLVHSIQDLSLAQTHATFPSPSPTGVVALGPRWLAYAANQPLRADGASAAPTTTYGSPLLDVGVGVAGMAATGAKQLGELGLRTLNSYLSSSPPTLTEPTEPALDYAGSVIVRDIDTQQVLYHFRAHDAPLGIISFDPSGLLLITAAVDGRNINIFEVSPDPSRPAPSAPKHLYKLVRGVTTSTIQDIAFSIDTRWVAVTSNRGTAHLYPLNPDGSPASVDSHVPSPAANAAWPLYPLSASYAAVPSPPITVFAVARIRTSDGASATGAAAEGAAASVLFCLPSASTVYTQLPPAVSAVFMVSGDGVLARYQLRPYALAEPETQRETLQLEMQCQGTLDICRRRTWAEQRCPAERLASWETAPESAPGGSGCMPEWVSHVEIYTHERAEDSVWASRMFVFKPYQAEALAHGARAGRGGAAAAAAAHCNVEELPCVQLGGAASPSPGGCRGEDELDLDDYFVVQAGPRPGTVAQPPLLGPGFPGGGGGGYGAQDGGSRPGVYGGLPAGVAAGSKSGGEADGSPPAMVGGWGAGEGGPLSSLSRSRSMDIGGSSSGSREKAAWQDEVFGGGAAGGQPLEGLGWDDGEASDEMEGPGRGFGGGESERGSPGLAASSMMIFDEDLDAGQQQRLSTASTREKWHDNFVLEGDEGAEGDAGACNAKPGLDGSCAAASEELNEGAFAGGDDDLADFLATSIALPKADAAEDGGDEDVFELPPTVVAKAAGADAGDEEAGMEIPSGEGSRGLDASDLPPGGIAASPEVPLSPGDEEESPPEQADPEQEEASEAKSSGAALSKKDKKKKKKKSKW